MRLGSLEGLELTKPGGWGSLGLGILRSWSIPGSGGHWGGGQASHAAGVSSWGILELGRALQGVGVSLRV